MKFNLKKTSHRLIRSLKKTFHKKKNQRKLIAVVGLFLIAGTLSALFINNAHDNRQKLQLQRQVELKQQEAQTKAREIEQTRLQEQQAKEQKQHIEHQLNESNGKIHDLEIKLQSKRRTPVRLASSRTQPRPATSHKPSSARRVAGPNTYSRGYCTWHVKNLRPDIPNNLGNADTWYSRAKAQGMAVGSAPRVGAVAWARTGYMHVAVVIGVSGNNVTVSEMNVRGWNVVSTRTTPASAWLYIY